MVSWLWGCAGGGGEANSSSGGSANGGSANGGAGALTLSGACDPYCAKQAMLNCPLGETVGQCAVTCRNPLYFSGCEPQHIALTSCMANAPLICDGQGYPAVGEECFPTVDEFISCTFTGGTPPPLELMGCVQENMVQFDEWLSDIVVEGNRAYFFLKDFSGCHGLLAYDVTNPAQPIEIGRMEGVCADDFAVKGGIVYASTQSPALLVVANFNNPASPVADGFVNVGGELALAGNHAYLKTFTDLVPVDITNPAAMVVGEELSVIGGDEIYSVGSVLYLVGGLSTLTAYDLTSPAVPTVIGEWGASLLGSSPVVVAAGSTLYIVNEDGLYPFDISNPAAPVALLPYLDEFRSVRDIEVRGNFAYLAGHSDIKVLNVANPQAITSVQTKTSDETGFVAAVGSYLYVTMERAAFGQGRLHILRCE